MLDANRATIEGYRIKKKIGSGGMASVYLAENSEKNPPKVAIKILDESLCDDDKYISRFKREALISSKLINHPNIIKVFKYGSNNNLHYILMEYANGRALSYYIKRKKRFSINGVENIMLMVCSSLSLSHKKKIIHRDIKPQNIIIDGRSNIKITDFGIAKVYGMSNLTLRDENVMGTVFYMSPEQIQGEKIDSRTDIYSLGILSYELLTGTTPYYSENTWKIMEEHLHKTPIPIKRRRRDVPDYLVSIINKCIAKKKEDRYKNIDLLLKALKNKEAPEAIVERRAYLLSREGRERFDLDYSEVYIGRRELNHIGIEDMLISRRHARIITTDNRYVLEDLDSRNGTFVNDIRIDRYVLQDGDNIKIGRNYFIFTMN